ncbi:MAG: putative toxin-antitoxin system toxin component, PIN family [Deltaproteobacteria bacterium]|nr:putative toxin-antitoxin system toxin component, PIN family [Deltaproteobacteria bacterium]
MEKRVVVDTNIVLSGFLSSKGAPAKILNAWVSQQFTPLVSLELKQEYFSVLEYRHIKERLASRYTRAHEMLTAIIKIAKFVNIKNPKIHLFSDTDDDILAEIAIQGKAHYIISGDKAVLNVKRYKDIEIVSATEFLEIFL